MTVWRSTLSLTEIDVLDARLEARIRGLLVVDKPVKQRCQIFDSVGGKLGVFRTFGRLHFDKTDRRWVVQPLQGATPAEFATLLNRGNEMIRMYGTKPGHNLREKVWRHSVGSYTGHSYACTFLARPVGIDELRELTVAEAIDDMFTSATTVAQVSHSRQLT